MANSDDWTGPQGIVHIAPGDPFGPVIISMGVDKPLGLASDATHLYWMATNAQGSVTLWRGLKDASDDPIALASDFHWSRGFAVTDTHVYFIASSCPEEDGKSLVRIAKPQ